MLSNIVGVAVIFQCVAKDFVASKQSINSNTPPLVATKVKILAPRQCDIFKRTVGATIKSESSVGLESSVATIIATPPTSAYSMANPQACLQSVGHHRSGSRRLDPSLKAVQSCLWVSLKQSGR